MITHNQRNELKKAAEELLGCKWHWRGWLPHKGKVDCLFSTFWMLSKAGIVEHRGAGYNYYRKAAGLRRETNLAEIFIREILHVTEIPEPEDGAIVIFRAGRQSSHMGVIVGGGIAHAVYGKKFAIEPLGQWSKYIHCFLRVTTPKYKKLPSTVEIDTL